MNLYRVTLVEPPTGREKKHRLHRYAVIAESESSAIDKARNEASHFETTDAFVVIEPDEVISVRLSLATNEQLAVLREAVKGERS